ncbi:YbhB/YbcL family Raf kinase inhibitor-like protein [Amycolatopsis anabasis]|uniref:YbhB/YbcL family Raf kinase inhibitor-like protein n=1 Tax=Amycolatopsis anabasis TaxID=1840409 RepID=UPI001FE277E6|nr:YbhB/YbcL family Raf kinase inhibitor-like protein [Amycolatopsis anabasis]
MQRDHPPRPLGDPDRAAGPLGTGGTSRGDPALDDPTDSTAFALRSSAFNDHTLIPDRYSYGGGNFSPPLEWSPAPDGTEELVLLCSDPDAPGGTFVHWIVARISPDRTEVAEGALPAGAVVGRNDFGELGWGGPQPPVGDAPHRYFFRLYAADQPLGFHEGAGADDLRAALDDHVIAQATLVGRFGR